MKNQAAIVFGIFMAIAVGVVTYPPILHGWLDLKSAIDEYPVVCKAINLLIFWIITETILYRMTWNTMQKIIESKIDSLEKSTLQNLTEKAELTAKKKWNEKSRQLQARENHIEEQEYYLSQFKSKLKSIDDDEYRAKELLSSSESLVFNIQECLRIASEDKDLALSYRMELETMCRSPANADSERIKVLGANLELLGKRLIQTAIDTKSIVNDKKIFNAKENNDDRIDLKKT